MLATRMMRLPWWTQTLAIYLASRIVSTVFLLVAAANQGATPWAAAHPSYQDFVGRFWDNGWYDEIARDGYPDELPTRGEGTVLQNAWAFYPAMPWMSRMLMGWSGAPYSRVAPLLALVFGGVAMILIDRLVTTVPRAPRAAVLGTVALVCVFPSSPVLQAGYTESVALALIAGFLYLLRRRWYELACVAVLALGFTRAVALPMVVVVSAHIIGLVISKRRGRLVGTSTFVRAGILVAVSLVAGFAWQALTALATGRSDAYLATQLAWRTTKSTLPVEPWLIFGSRWLSGWGLVIFAAIAVVIIALVLTPAAKRLGPEMWTFAWVYPLYLVGVGEPGTSMFRFALLDFPIAAILALSLWPGAAREPTPGLGGALMPRGRWRQPIFPVLLAVSLMLQFAWVFSLWRLDLMPGWPP